MTGIKWFKGTLVCFLAGMFCSYQFMMQGAPAVMIPELVASLDLDLLEVSWVTSSFLYVYLILQVPGGIVADHFPSRTLLTISCLLMGLACYLLSIADSFSMAVIARGLMGVATAPSVVICLGLASRWFPLHWFPVMSGVVEFFAVAGGAAGPLLIPALMEASGWRDSLWELALYGWCLALFVALLVRDGPVPEIKDAGQELLAKKQKGQWRQLFRTKDFWLCASYGFGMFTFISTFGGLWSIPFLMERFPGEDSTVRQAVSLIYLGAALGAPGIGLMATVIGHYRKLMMGSALLLTLLTLWVLYSDCSLAGVCWLCFIIGFCSGGYMLIFSSVRNIAPPAVMGASLAAVNGSCLLGGPLLQPLTGMVLGQLSGDGLDLLSVEHYRLSFLPIVIGQLMGLVSAYLMSPAIEAEDHCKSSRLSKPGG